MLKSGIKNYNEYDNFPVDIDHFYHIKIMSIIYQNIFQIIKDKKIPDTN